MTTTLRCRGCSATVRIPETSSVGDMMRSSGGWHPMASGCGGERWLCPTCGKKIGGLAHLIKSLVAPHDDSYIDFDSLLMLPGHIEDVVTDRIVELERLVAALNCGEELTEAQRNHVAEICTRVGLAVKPDVEGDDDAHSDGVEMEIP